MIVFFLFGVMVYILFEVMVYIFSTTPCRVEAVQSLPLRDASTIIVWWTNRHGTGQAAFPTRIIKYQEDLVGLRHASTVIVL